MDIDGSRMSFSGESRTGDVTQRGESSVSVSNRSNAQRFSNWMNRDNSSSPGYSDDSRSNGGPTFIDLTGNEDDDDDDEESRRSVPSAKRSNDDESHEGSPKRQRSE